MNLHKNSVDNYEDIHVSVKNINFQYGEKIILRNLSLEINGLLIVIVIVYKNSLNSLIKLINRDLLSLYLNGMSSKEITSQFYKTIESGNKKVYIFSYGTVILFAILLSKALNNEVLMMITVGLLLLLSLFILLNKLFVKYVISRLLAKELSNENIVSQLRN